MLLTFLVESAAGGQSKLGGIVQRGIRIVRKVLHGEKPRVTQGEPERSLVKFQPINQSSNAVRGSVISVIRDGARGILSNYLARNQFHSLASEMRNRYAVHLMSGSARLNSGLGRKVALYGFVGVSFAGVVQNRFHAREGFDPVECSIQDLFKKKHEIDPISEQFSTSNGEIKLSGFRQRMSISEESDITILSDKDIYEDDFEVIEVDELSVITDDRTKIEGSNGVLTNLELENKMLRRNNAILSKTLDIQTTEDNSLRKELQNMLNTVEVQQKELEKLRDLVNYQNSLLMVLSEQLENGGNRMKKCDSFGSKPAPGLDQIGGNIREKSSSEELDMEMLRAAGGRVRGLKIHRKKRMKNA